jgi:hypothetical protein
MVSVLASHAGDRGSNPGRFKPDFKIGICCFSTKYTVLSSRSKD